MLDLKFCEYSDTEHFKAADISLLLCLNPSVCLMVWKWERQKRKKGKGYYTADRYYEKFNYGLSKI